MPISHFFYLLLSILVKFNNCAGNKGVRYETNSLDFKVRADGTMYAVHEVQMASKQLILMVTAWDPQTLGRWETIVRFLVGEKLQHNGHKVGIFSELLFHSSSDSVWEVTGWNIGLIVLSGLCFQGICLVGNHH